MTRVIRMPKKVPDAIEQAYTSGFRDGKEKALCEIDKFKEEFKDDFTEEISVTLSDPTSKLYNVVATNVRNTEDVSKEVLYKNLHKLPLLDLLNLLARKILIRT